ncbi:unnamed protein product [Phyllotreta striolata]|uniref:Protein hunchback n=1 Tax=Phyllotreta striolata TaxID=444603 RepID=A0A9N9XQT5_PHYSR|nr:unnamed protein product [Phyllotreta striolata]
MDPSSVEDLSENCRICLERVVRLDQVKSKQLLYLKEGISTDGAAMCSSCADKSRKLVDFKAEALKNFNFLKNYRRNSGVMSPVDIVKLEADNVCLFCLNPSDKSRFKDCTLEIIEKYMPEITLSSIPHPFICGTCEEDLKQLVNFFGSCQDSGNKIGENIEIFEKTEAQIKMETDLSMVKEENCVNIKQEVDCYFEEIEALSPHPDIKIEMEEDEETEEATESIPQETPSKTFSCPYCSYRNHRRSNLASHLLVHEKSAGGSPMFSCDACRFSSKWRSSLLTHKLLHKASDELDMFECHNCGYRTKYKKHLRRHMKLHRVEMFYCPLCPYKTKKSERLKAHKCKPDDGKVDSKFERKYELEEGNGEAKVKEKAEEYQPDPVYELFTKIVQVDKWYYTCNVCQYQTVKIYRIKDHVMRHRKERNQKCHICDYTAKYKRTVREHIKNRH